MNGQEEMFGFDRTGGLILEGRVEELTATQLIDCLMGEVQEFVGDIPRADDMTCVVVRAE